MTMTDARALPRWKIMVLWGLKGLVAAVFLLAGSVKIFGLPMMVQEFQHMGLGKWFRYATGTLEVIGAITILMPGRAAFGAILLSCIMVGAILTHLFLIGGSPIPAVILLALSATIAFAHRDQIGVLFGAIDTGDGPPLSRGR